MNKGWLARIADTDRRITRLTNPATGAPVAWVGFHGVTEIVSYSEPGDGAAVPWLAVLVGDSCVLRIAARHVAIHYEKPAEAQP